MNERERERESLRTLDVIVEITLLLLVLGRLDGLVVP
jgi:hypothetical protein